MSSWVLSIFVFLPIVFNPARGRLTEITTERLPILGHNLHKTNINLKTISKRALLGPRSEFRIQNGEFFQTPKGSQRVRLVQTYADYEVYGPTAVAELNTRGHFTGHLYGNVARNLHKDIPNPEACIRDITVLQNIAIRKEKLNPNDPNIDKRDGRRIIYADPNKRKARIVYVVEFFFNGDRFISLPVYYFDACSNNVMFSYNDVRNFTIPQRKHGNEMNYTERKNSSFVKFDPEMIKRLSKVGAGCAISAKGKGGNRRIGRIDYNSPPFCLPVRRARASRCVMEGEYFNVVDNKQSRGTSNNKIANFRCNTGYSDSVNGAYGVANDAFFYGELTGRFFQMFFGRRPLPYKSRIVVHYGRNYENAFWTGGDMYFGDGKELFYPLVSLDIVAHELAHGFTRQHSNLIYRGQSGGINEAYSDISGVATISFISGRDIWELGADVMKAKRKALRYVNDPPKDGRSIKNAWLFRPRMNVHASSGVFNYAFYKMSKALLGSMQDAYASFYTANALLWGKLTGFRRGACNVMQASYDIGVNHRVVRRAFASTGIPLIFCSKRGLRTTLFPGETRQNILVSQSRSPVLEVDMTHWSGFAVKAKTESYPDIVRIEVATDEDADHVIAKGNNYVEFPTNHTRVQVKLMSDHNIEVKVTLKVLN